MNVSLVCVGFDLTKPSKYSLAYSRKEVIASCYIYHSADLRHWAFISDLLKYKFSLGIQSAPVVMSTGRYTEPLNYYIVLLKLI